MTNPVQAMRLLITYVVIIPLAVLVGYLLTDPMDYGTLGFLVFIIAVLISPVFIKWHYPIMVFGLACPAVCFFLPGRPPLAQVVVVMSLGIAIVERAMSSDRRFLSFPVMTWPLLFIAAMAYLTAQLTGGIGLHTMGGDVGGGKKYITLFIGVATYFALTSRAIPPHHRKWYLILFMLPGIDRTCWRPVSVFAQPVELHQSAVSADHVRDGDRRGRGHGQHAVGGFFRGYRGHRRLYAAAVRIAGHF